MKNLKRAGVATVAAAALISGLVGVAAPAIAAPTGTGNAQDTISSLEQQGYQVIVNRLSNKPLSESSVVSVGEGASFTHADTNAKNHQSYTDYGHQFAPVQQRTIYVNVR